MIRIFTILLLSILFFSPAKAQWPDQVIERPLTPNIKVESKGNLSQGFKVNDLTFAARSSNACWPGTQNAKFRGNHVLYGSQIPPQSELEVRLIPDDPKANFSLYGYQIGTTYFTLPENLRSCVSCEADHKWDYPKRGKTQDHTRSISFNSIRNPYNIVIGVVGGEGQTSGGYTLEYTLVSTEEPSGEQAALKVYRIEGERGSTKAWNGDLSAGVFINDLSWAANSSNACWPATQNKKFRGKHLFYVTEIPPRSKMTITLVPEDKSANFSLYAYQDGVSSKAYPPDLPRCVSCEADHKWDYPKRGKTQNHTRSVSLNAIQNPYRVVIGVVGAEGLDTGKFQVQVTLE